MKKLKKNQLEFNKEVITSLTENELSILHGGDGTGRTFVAAASDGLCPSKVILCLVTAQIGGCVQTTPQTQCGAACGTIQIPPTQVTCQQSVCVICKPEMSKDVICP